MLNMAFVFCIAIYCSMVNVMSLVDVVLSRRSIRSYKQEEIPRNVLEKILEAGRQAPSAANRQPWHFIVITDHKIKKKLSQWRLSKFVKESAFTIAGCAYADDYLALIDTSIALQNMVIAAWALGIGSCWIAGFEEDKAKIILNIPEDWKVIALITFGYPSDKPSVRQKKLIDEIVSYNDMPFE